MHFINLYQPGPDGAGYVVKQTGTLRPFDTRELAYHHIVFPLSIFLKRASKPSTCAFKAAVQ